MAGFWQCGHPFRPTAATEATNPVTRSVVRVIPPFELASYDEFEAVCEHFKRWCAEKWADGQQDPQEIEIPASWRQPCPS